MNSVDRVNSMSSISPIGHTLLKRKTTRLLSGHYG